jgi:hypothetical protein
MPLQEQDRRLLRVRGRGPERTLLRAQAREPLWQQERRLLRHEDRVLVWVQVQCRNLVLLGYEYRRPVRGPSMGPERWLLQRQERMLCPALCRPQERGPGKVLYRGQGLPRPSRGWEKL